MKNKPRKKWLAAFLTLLTMGLGHIYCGEIKKGLVLIGIHYLLLLLGFVLLHFFPSITSLVIIAIMLLIYFLYCLIDTIRISRDKVEYYQLKSYNRWYVYILVVVIFVLFPRPLTRAYIKENIAKTFFIPAGSMKPTLLIGDLVLAKMDRISKSNINRGDLIIFNSPQDQSRIFIKRVIGLGGETIAINNKKVTINNRILSEPYAINSDIQLSNHRDNLNSIKIPENSFFVLGDNRDNSYDSRFWGSVEKSEIIGKAVLLLWSWDSKKQEVRWNRLGKSLN